MKLEIEINQKIIYSKLKCELFIEYTRTADKTIIAINNYK